MSRPQVTGDRQCETCMGWGYLTVPFTGGMEAECTMCDGMGEIEPEHEDSGPDIDYPAHLKRTAALLIPVVIAVCLTSGNASARTTPAPVHWVPQIGQATPGPDPCSSAYYDTQQLFGATTQDKIAREYGLTKLYRQGDLGKGVTIALFELENVDLSDVAKFDACYFWDQGKHAWRQHLTHVHIVSLGGKIATSEGESELDVENLQALAPDATIKVYEAPNTWQGDLAEWAAIIKARPQVASTSWSICEPYLAGTSPAVFQAENALLKRLAADGTSVFAAAGDQGSEGCSYLDRYDLTVQDPSSSPYVLGVGGTDYTGAVWNDGNFLGATGGGMSDVWARPVWQKAPGVDNVWTADRSYEHCGAVACRQVPDVSAFAGFINGITMYSTALGGWIAVAGTSSAAPIWAAVLAEVDASQQCHGVRPGFVAPALYKLARNPKSYEAAFTDVQRGGNDALGTNDGAYPATPGYDMATGLGTPKAPGLVAGLC